jgi:hypothetical protein
LRPADAGADWSVLRETFAPIYGLTFEDPVAREIRELKAAQKYGLTRQEYMRRKSLGARYCASETTFCYQRIMETGKVDTTVSPDQDDPGAYGSPIK